MELTRQCVDFRNRMRGFKAVRKVLLHHLQRNLRGQFFSILPRGVSSRKVGRRLDRAVRFDFDDN